RKQIGSVFDELTNLIQRAVSKKGPGVLALPGLVKIKRVTKPATKARQGRNPATGEPMMIKAKPAHTVVRAQPLKSLKEMVKQPQGPPREDLARSIGESAKSTKLRATVFRNRRSS